MIAADTDQQLTTTHQEGTHAVEFQSPVTGLRCQSGCDPTDFDFTSGNFTAGGWYYLPTSLSGTDHMMGTMTNEGGGCSTNGGGWRQTWDEATDKYRFVLCGASGNIPAAVSTSSTYSHDAWHHAVVRYTDASSLLEQVLDGALDSNTTTHAGPGNNSSPFSIVNGVFSRVPVGAFADELFVFSDAMANTDVCRIAVCQIDGLACQCDWAGTPANYSSRARHSSEGGPISCTMPACDKSAPD
jgi:hypothetical protein